MADPKTYSEDEHLAILSDRIARETASLTAERDQLATEKAEAQNKADAAESAKIAAEARATEAEQKLADAQAETEREREAAARKDDRLAKVKEVAPHLGEDFFTDERVQRIVAMEEDAFPGYLSDLKDSATVPAGHTVVPRETAMIGAGVQPPANGKPSAARALLLARYETPQEG